MADKPIFSPDQDMSNVSPADVAEAKQRAKETTAYDKANKTPPSPKPTASEPKKMAMGGTASSRRIVSKKELEESGLSLRDFLNKERGLTRKPPEDTKFGVNKPRPSAQDRATMEAQDNANRGLDENGEPLQRTAAYVPRDQYTQSGKATVDKQDAISKRDASMKNYTPRRDPNANAREALSRGDSDEAGNAMKRGGKVKKMASGGMTVSRRADGIAQRGKTRGKMC